jgi:hypothetical protein
MYTSTGEGGVRGDKKYCTMRRFMVYTPNKYSGALDKEDERGGMGHARE